MFMTLPCSLSGMTLDRKTPPQGWKMPTHTSGERRGAPTGHSTTHHPELWRPRLAGAERRKGADSGNPSRLPRIDQDGSASDFAPYLGPEPRSADRPGKDENTLNVTSANLQAACGGRKQGDIRNRRFEHRHGRQEGRQATSPEPLSWRAPS